MQHSGKLHCGNLLQDFECSGETLDTKYIKKEYSIIEALKACNEWCGSMTISNAQCCKYDNEVGRESCRLYSGYAMPLTGFWTNVYGSSCTYGKYDNFFIV